MLCAVSRVESVVGALLESRLSSHAAMTAKGPTANCPVLSEELGKPTFGFRPHSGRSVRFYRRPRFVIRSASADCTPRQTSDHFRANEARRSKPSHSKPEAIAYYRRRDSLENLMNANCEYPRPAKSGNADTASLTKSFTSRSASATFSSSTSR